jgi:predicted HTH transcriptional regulator
MGEYKTITKRASILLNRQESFDVEYKKSLSDLDAEDFVAFANSDSGGSILVGVEEYHDKKGKQRSRIIGCSVGDKSKRKILDRAESCIPPVDVEIHLENLSDKPFIRIEIPSSNSIPHSTAGGTYKIRGDGRNMALPPSRLLVMFAEAESNEFLNRFEKATAGLEERLGSIQAMAEMLGINLSDTFRSAAGAEEVASEAMDMSTISMELSEGIIESMELLHIKIDALLEKLDIENPEEVIRYQQIKELEQILEARFPLEDDAP